MKEQLLSPPGSRMVVEGNEAIAKGAIEAHVKVFTTYPGTPSSEVAETLIDLQEAVGNNAQWSINEKAAFDMATGPTMVGARTLTVIRGAGLNWAMDTFLTLPLTDVRDGFAIVVADDPGANYSSDEQDSRVSAQWAGIPCFESANQQDAKDLTKAVFELSEHVELPVLLRSVTRLTHASEK